MIGFYDYSVILTYLSLLSGCAGIMSCFIDSGHPYIACYFLMFSGLCDAFDGKVASTKKNRSEMQRNYGIQIDSLSDIVAFGVLPACIGGALINLSPFINSIFTKLAKPTEKIFLTILMYSILCLFVLFALIRLAYFNVTEEERQKKEDCSRKYYLGLPVTSSALIFPAVMLLQYLVPSDITIAYLIAILITGLLFVIPFKLRKPGLKYIFILIGIGLVEFVVIILWRFNII